MTPKNDELMNERERGLLRLLANAMNDLGKLRDSIAASRDAQGEDALPCPLRVGAGTFGKGIKISTVQGAIDRAISYRDDEISNLRAAQGEDEGWRTDIENAPKDGSTIIIPGGIAYYRENKTYPHYSGWHSITGIEMPGRPLQYELKKWMPFPVLPAPPVIGE